MSTASLAFDLQGLRQPAKPALRIKDLSVKYGAETVLKGVNLDVRQGEILSLIGPNGAGKSTLFKTILGLLPAANGEVEFCRGFGRVTTGFVPQMAALDRNTPFSVQELLTLNMPGRRFWFGGRSLRSAAEEKLALLDGGHLISRAISDLSGGEFQKVMIAYALLRKPNLLILDEPSTGVDHEGTHMLQRLICHLRNEEALTIIMASHDLHLVQLVSDRVCCLNREVCSVGTAGEVLHGHYLKEFYAFGGKDFRVKA